MHIIEATPGLSVRVTDGKPYNLPRGSLGVVVGRDGENVTVNVNGNNVTFAPSHLIIKDRAARLSTYKSLVSSAESAIKHYKKAIKKLEKAKSLAEIATEVRDASSNEEVVNILSKYFEG